MYGESIGAITLDFSDLERSMPRSLRFQRLKGAELGHVLVLNTDMKSHREPNSTITFDCEQPWKVKVKGQIFEGLLHVCRKWAKIGPMLLVNLTMKAYMFSTIVCFIFDLSDLAMSLKILNAYISWIAELSHMLLLKTKRKSYMVIA